jgi:hypothetical protein
MQQIAKVLLRGGRISIMMMKSISDSRMIPNGANTLSRPNGGRFRGMGEDIEDDYPVCRQALERSSSKMVAL